MAGILLLGAPPSLNEGRAWVNGFEGFAFANVIKAIGAIGAGSTAFPSTTNSDGYPANGASLATAITQVIGVDDTYYGHWGIEWTGQGSFQLSPQTIIYNGGANVTGLGGSNTGSAPFNFAIVGKTAPVVEFAFGCIITGIADNGSGLVRLTASLASTFTNVGTGSLYQVNNVTNLAPGPWTITKIDNNNIDLQGSTYNGTMAVIGGTPGTCSEAILAQTTSVTWNFLTTGPYSNMSNLLWYKMSNQALVRANPNAFTPDYIARMQELKPYGIRFMDSSSTNNCNYVDFSHRYPLTSFGLSGFRWDNDPVTGYWVGQSSGTDTYTCSNPPGSGGGAYTHGETVQLQFVNANATYAPTLNLNSRGAVPLIDGATSAQSIFKVTGTVLAGDQFSVTFTASYLSGGFQTVTITGQTTAAGATAALSAAIQANANLLANNINVGFSGNTNITYINYAVASGALAITQSTTSGGAVINIGTVAPGFISANLLATCVYDSVFNAFLVSTGGLHCGLPMELQVDLCNQLGCHLWVTLSHLFSTTSAQAAGALVGGRLNSNLKCYVEASNELWNFIFHQTAYGTARGINWGIPIASLQAMYSFYAYLCATLLPEFATGFGARAGLNKVMAFQQYLGTSVSVNKAYRFEGAALVPSALYTGANYSTPGNRPYEIACDTISWANYISGAQLSNFDANYNNFLTFGGPDSNAVTIGYTGLLGAADAYAAGGATNISSAFDFIDWDIRGGLRAKSSQTITGSNAAGVLRLTGPTLANGTKIIFGFTSGGSVPDAVTAGKTYYVVGTSGTTCNVSLTLGGSAIAYGTTNGTNLIYGLLGDQTLEFQNVTENPLIAAIPAAYSKAVDLYEGAMESWYPSTDKCTSNGISTTYGGSTGKIAILLHAYKKDARFKQFALDTITGLQSLSPPARPNWYRMPGAGIQDGYQWSLETKNLYGTFYKSWDALVEYNN